MPQMNPKHMQQIEALIKLLEAAEKNGDDIDTLQSITVNFVKYDIPLNTETEIIYTMDYQGSGSPEYATMRALLLRKDQEPFELKYEELDIS